MFEPIIPNAGLLTFSDIVMSWIGGGANAAKVHLFSNDYAPDAATTLSSFAEASNAGLTARPTPTPTRLGLDPLGRVDWIFPTVSFTITAGPYPAYVFGFWVDCTDPETDLTGLLWAQRFPTGFVFRQAGDAIQVNMFQSFGQCPPGAGPYTQFPHRIPDRRVRKGAKLWPPR